MLEGTTYNDKNTDIHAGISVCAKERSHGFLRGTAATIKKKQKQPSLLLELTSLISKAVPH